MGKFFAIRLYLLSCNCSEAALPALPRCLTNKVPYIRQVPRRCATPVASGASGSFASSSRLSRALHQLRPWRLSRPAGVHRAALSRLVGDWSTAVSVLDSVVLGSKSILTHKHGKRGQLLSMLSPAALTLVAATRLFKAKAYSRPANYVPDLPTCRSIPRRCKRC